MVQSMVTDFSDVGALDRDYVTESLDLARRAADPFRISRR